MRVKPKPAIAWLIVIGYAGLFLALEAVTGVAHEEIAASTGTG